MSHVRWMLALLVAATLLPACSERYEEHREYHDRPPIVVHDGDRDYRDGRRDDHRDDHHGDNQDYRRFDHDDRGR